MRTLFTMTIDPAAPERMRGREVSIVLEEKKLSFLVDMPEDATPQEVGYFDWVVGELMDRVKGELPGLVGDGVARWVPDDERRGGRRR